jgi:hypothetical protein
MAGQRFGDIDPGGAGAVGARGFPMKSAISSYKDGPGELSLGCAATPLSIARTRPYEVPHTRTDRPC